MKRAKQYMTHFLNQSNLLEKIKKKLKYIKDDFQLCLTIITARLFDYIAEPIIISDLCRQKI